MLSSNFARFKLLVEESPRGFDTKKYNVHRDKKKIAAETWRVTNERNS